MFTINTEEVLRDIKIKKTEGWLAAGKKNTLSLFHAAAERVPAYKDFLKKHKVDHRKIKTAKDFSLVPPTGKDNYFHAYPFPKLFWDGNLQKPLTIHATSGSTGEPTYFQREFGSDLMREVIIENFFQCNPLTIEGPTLFVVTFGMGVWSAGVGIYTATYLANNLRQFPISIVSPGVNKSEVLKILRKLAPNFQQVVIAGYPPFVKDIIDEALQEGINVKKFNLRFVFTGEAFTEEFRDYISQRTKMKNIFTDTMNTYGTSELGAIAVETPVAIFGRRLAYRNKKIFQALFGGTIKTPTLAQYIPSFVNFECIDGELFFTGDSATPFVKYQSGDHGGLLTFQEFSDALSGQGVRLASEARRLGIAKYIHELPFVYVYERKNLATTIYGILIYPEFIKTALFNKHLTPFLTGKFTVITQYDEDRNQYLEINLELRKGSLPKKKYERTALIKITETLQKKSSEFRELSTQMKDKTFIKVILWPYEYPEFFMGGMKQKWMRKA